MCVFHISTEDRNILILALGFTEADLFIKKTMFSHFTLAKDIISKRSKDLYSTTVARKIKDPKLDCVVHVKARATRSNSDLERERFIMREIKVELKDFKYKELLFTLNDYMRYEFETHVLQL